MKKTVPLFLMLFALTSLHAQINIQWIARYTSAGNNVDRAKDLAVDSAGNVYVTGTSWNGSNFDYLTIKYDPAGNQLWATPYNGPGAGYDEARAITVDTSGNVYVTGYSAGAASNYDIATIKYNSAGVQQWAARYDGPAAGFDEAYDVEVDGNGNVYVAGSATAAATGTNYATLKYNAAGSFQWAASYTFSGNNTDAAYVVKLDNFGDVYVTGYSYGSTANDFDIATVKYNSAGSQQWVSRYNGPGSNFDAANDLVVDQVTGDVFVCGYARGVTGVTNYEAVAIKINGGGAQQWAAVYAGAGNDYDRFNSIALDPSGNVIVTGRSVGTNATAEDAVTISYTNAGGIQNWERRYDGGVVNYDEGKQVTVDALGDIYVVGYSYTGGNNNNYLLVKYDNSGNQQWLTKYNGTGNNSDQAFALHVDNIGNIFVTGLSRGSGTNDDYATIKYCQLTANAGTDQAICLGATTTLSVSALGLASVVWAPSTGLDSTNTATTTAHPNATTTYTVAVTNVNGCTDYDTVTIVVNPLPGPSIMASGDTTFCLGGSVTLTAQAAGAAGYSWNTGDTTQSITVDSSGLYLVVLTDTNTCSSQSQINVIVNPLPTISTIGDTAICTSTSVSLCAMGGTQFSWSPSFGLSDTTIACPIAGPTSTTTYYVIGTDANGCVGSDSVTVTILGNPPVPTVTETAPDLCSTTATTYQWYFNGNPISGATNQCYTPTGNGNYYVEITDANGCTSFSSVFVMNDVGLAELGLQPLKIFPNPSNGIVQIEIDPSADAVLDILNEAGQIVYSEKWNAGVSQHRLDLGAFAGGLYLVRVSAGTQQFGARVLVVH